MIKLGIRTRLTVGIIAGVVVISVIMLGNIALHNLKSDKETARDFLSNTCDLLTARITGELNIGLGRTRSLVNTFESIRFKESGIQDGILYPFLEKGMEADSNYLAIWISYELKYIDHAFAKHAGRKTWLVDILDGHTKRRIEYRGTAGQLESPQYLEIKKTKRETLIDPYWYKIQDESSRQDSILEASMGVPIVYRDTVIGLAGIDFKLSRFNTTIENVIANSAYRDEYLLLGMQTFMISNDGTVVASPDYKDIRPGENISAIPLFQAFIDNGIHNASNGRFNYREDFFYRMNVINLGNTDRPWYICMMVPEKNIMSQANRAFLLSVIIGLAGLSLMVLLIYYLLAPLLKPIASTTTLLDKLSQGEIDDSISLAAHNRHEIGVMAASVNRIRERFKGIAGFAAEIGRGKLDAVYPYENKGDLLGTALKQMQADLVSLRTKTDREVWIKTGIGGLNEAFRSATDLKSLADKSIHYIADYLNVTIGVMFYADEQQKTLTFGAGFRFSHDNATLKPIPYGEGLPGECAVSRRLLVLDRIEDSWLPIKSATGTAVPRQLAMIPCLYNGHLMAVIELGTLTSFREEALEILGKFADSLAITVQTVRGSDEMALLLAKTLEQKEELQAQEEELREANRTLEKQARELRISEEGLQTQQEELKVSNQELEKNSQMLEEQSERIAEKNRALEKASREIEAKAAELELASRYKSEFLANMSHELRTPLNSMLILSQSLAENSSGNLGSDEIESAQIIYKSGNDLHNLINDILDLSKIEAGKMSVNPERIEIRQVAGNISALYRATAAGKGLTWTVSVEPGCPVTMITDPMRLEQIIKNLVSNAIKFTTRGGVTVTFDRASELTAFSKQNLTGHSVIAISVSDTGIGIPPEKQQLIFEAFQQADGSTSRKFGGTGLGLSISRELSRLLGGEIHVSSHYGEGSVFTLLLPQTNGIEAGAAHEPSPLADEPKPTQIKEDQKPAYIHAISNIGKVLAVDDDRRNLGNNSPSILVIEDDPEFAGILVKECHKKEFQCIVAGDGQTGIEMARKFMPAAIILDIMLPDIDGWKVLDVIKHDARIRHIPVHMMSALDETIEAYQKGAIGYLKKPVNTASLSNAFEKIGLFLKKTTKRLLIVEDNDTMRKTMSQLLRGTDITITEAMSAGGCMEALKKSAYDCIILDLGLPDSSGLNLVRDIRELDLSPTPPIIVYTGQELTREQNDELNLYTKSIIIKGVRSEERLLDEATLFLHRVIEDLPQQQQSILRKLYDREDTFEEKTILLVDDDMRNIFALSKVFVDKGVKVLKAENGIKALKLLSEPVEVDAILMDIMMPEMDGYETIREIRKFPKFSKTPIIALTAKAMKEDRQKCMDAGASDYITKPIDMNKLMSLLRIWLKK